MAVSSPPRVGFVVHVMQVAGAEVLIRETIRRLGPKIRPTIFCLDAVGRIGEELKAEGVDLVALNRRPGWDFSMTRRIAELSRERGIEIFHAHQYTPFFYAALAKPLIRPMPHMILTEHGRHYPDLVSPPRRAINRIVFDRLADSVNACCHFSARALCKVDGFAGARIQVIENGIDPTPHQNAATISRVNMKLKLGLSSDRRHIVHVARHHPVKDQAMLLRGFAETARHVPDVDLVLVGDGPLREELETLAKSLAVSERVHFVGIQSNVPEWLRAGDIFALTSVSEAASLTLLEAMASGLPVVVTDVGGNPEIVREGIGLRVPRSDFFALGAAFRQLLDDPQLASRLGDAAKARVESTYLLDQTIEAYYRLYLEGTGRRS